MLALFPKFKKFGQYLSIKIFNNLDLEEISRLVERSEKHNPGFVLLPVLRKVKEYKENDLYSESALNMSLLPYYSAIEDTESMMLTKLKTGDIDSAVLLVQDTLSLETSNYVFKNIRNDILEIFLPRIVEFLDPHYCFLQYIHQGIYTAKISNLLRSKILDPKKRALISDIWNASQLEDRTKVISRLIEANDFDIDFTCDVLVELNCNSDKILKYLGRCALKHKRTDVLFVYKAKFARPTVIGGLYKTAIINKSAWQFGILISLYKDTTILKKFFLNFAVLHACRFEWNFVFMKVGHNNLKDIKFPENCFGKTVLNYLDLFKDLIKANDFKKFREEYTNLLCAAKHYPGELILMDLAELCVEHNAQLILKHLFLNCGQQQNVILDCISDRSGLVSWLKSL